jgi:4-alpha-glucanotransferase
MHAEGYRWWIERFRRTFELVDLTRVDHFRGFVSYWAVPEQEPTAEHGRWMRGPGAAMFRAAERELGELAVVAEDLGVITEPVVRLRRELGFPGMAVLQFALGRGPSNPHLPENHHEQSVVYTGTHDNDTTVGWWTGGAGHSTRSEDDITREHDYARRYLGIDDEREVQWDLIRAALGSVADTAIIPAQDLLGLGSEARMNQPGTRSGNWRWQLGPGQLTKDVMRRLGGLTETYERTLRTVM